jgi:hypothetical protein
VIPTTHCGLPLVEMTDNFVIKKLGLRHRIYRCGNWKCEKKWVEPLDKKTDGEEYVRKDQ